MTQDEFEKSYRSLHLPLGMFALRLLGDVDNAQEVVQSAFVRAWEAIENGREIDAIRFKAYMYTAVRNAALTLLKRPGEVDITDIEVAPDEIDTSERDAAVWRAVDGLPERCRTIFLLSKRDGLSNAEIAEELSISIKTVENQMTKALSSLRSALIPEGRKIFFLPFL